MQGLRATPWRYPGAQTLTSECLCYAPVTGGHSKVQAGWFGHAVWSVVCSLPPWSDFPNRAVENTVGSLVFAAQGVLHARPRAGPGGPGAARAGAEGLGPPGRPPGAAHSTNAACFTNPGRRVLLN